MIPQRRITVEEVREHAARTKRGWGFWRRTDAEGNEESLTLRVDATAGSEEFIVDGSGDAYEESLLAARWTPIESTTGQPLAGHEDPWVTVTISQFNQRKVRWNGAKLIVETIEIKVLIVSTFVYSHYVAHDAASLASEFPHIAMLFATEAGASEEYRIAVLRALIDATMAKRGCGTVRTDFNPCAGVGFQWTAFVRSNVPRDGDDRRLAGRNPSAEAERGTELEALEALALFLGATS